MGNESKRKKNNVDEFIKIIESDYHEVPKHFWRIFEAEVYNEVEKDGNKVTDIYGCCAWSVYSCMCEGEGTYNTNDNGERRIDGTTLQEQSELLNLEIEVYSSESGMGFQEHYLYKYGEEIENECVDYEELYFENEEEFIEGQNEGYYEGYTWDDVNEDGYIKKGGLGDWEFCI